MKRFIGLLVLAIIFTLCGFFAGFLINKHRVVVSNDYFSNIIKTYNSPVAVLSIYSKGALKRLSNNEIVLSDNKGVVSTIPLNDEMRKKITYQDFISYRPAEKNDFTSGATISVRVSTDWITGKIIDLSFGLRGN